MLVAACQCQKDDFATFPHPLIFFLVALACGVLTHTNGEEGHLLSLLAVIVDRQVPDARVHVLDEARVMGGQGDQGPLRLLRLLLLLLLGGWGAFQGLNSLHQEPSPIQELHKVKLEMYLRGWEGERKH